MLQIFLKVKNAEATKIWWICTCGVKCYNVTNIFTFYTRNLSEDEIANVNFLRRHCTLTTKYENYAITSAEVYKNFIMVKSDLQLNLKIILSKCCNIPHLICDRLGISHLFSVIYTVFQKSDAKIQITLTTAHLIRINYPLSSFNHRLFRHKRCKFQQNPPHGFWATAF